MRPIPFRRTGWPGRVRLSGRGRWCLAALVSLGVASGCDMLLPILGQLITGNGGGSTTSPCGPAAGSGKLHDSQVTIEVRFITISDNFLERIGVDLDSMLDIEDANTAAGSFLPAAPTNEPVGVFLGDLGGGPLSSSSLNSLPSAGDQSGLSGILVGFLDDVEVDFLIRAAEQDNTVNVLSAPKITVVNCQQAHLSIGNEVRLVSELQQDFADTLIQVDPLIPFAVTGPSLSVTPVIINDMNIRLIIRPDVGVVFHTPDVQVDVNGGKVNADRPQVRTASVQTTVSVPDGGTVLLGGLIRKDQTEVSGVLPFFGNIPIIGRAFDNRTHVRDETELLILVTPRILSTE